MAEKKKPLPNQPWSGHVSRFPTRWRNNNDKSQQVVQVAQNVVHVMTWQLTEGQNRHYSVSMTTHLEEWGRSSDNKDYKNGFGTRWAGQTSRHPPSKSWVWIVQTGKKKNLVGSRFVEANTLMLKLGVGWADRISICTFALSDLLRLVAKIDKQSVQHKSWRRNSRWKCAFD